MNRMIFRKILGLTCVLVLINMSACGITQTADRTASIALEQLATYERDVNAKIATEEAYYDKVMRNATNRIKRIRDQEHVPALLKKAHAFAKGQGASPSASSVKSKLFGFANTSMREWSQREKEYAGLLEETQKALTTGRNKLETQKGKIKQLRVKIRAVSGPQSTGDMLKVLAAFAEGVGQNLQNTE